MLRFQLFPAIGSGASLLSLRLGPNGLTLPEDAALRAPFVLRQRETLVAGATDVYPLCVAHAIHGNLELSLTEAGLIDVILLEDGVAILEESCWGEFLARSFRLHPGRTYELRLINPSDYEVRYELGLCGREQAQAMRAVAA